MRPALPRRFVAEQAVVQGPDPERAVGALGEGADVVGAARHPGRVQRDALAAGAGGIEAGQAERRADPESAVVRGRQRGDALGLEAVAGGGGDAGGAMRHHASRGEVVVLQTVALGADPEPAVAVGKQGAHVVAGEGVALPGFVVQVGEDRARRIDDAEAAQVAADPEQAGAVEHQAADARFRQAAGDARVVQEGPRRAVARIQPQQAMAVQGQPQAAVAVLDDVEDRAARSLGIEGFDARRTALDAEQAMVAAETLDAVARAVHGEDVADVAAVDGLHLAAGRHPVGALGAGDQQLAAGAGGEVAHHAETLAGQRQHVAAATRGIDALDAELGPDPQPAVGRGGQRGHDAALGVFAAGHAFEAAAAAIEPRQSAAAGTDVEGAVAAFREGGDETLRQTAVDVGLVLVDQQFLAVVAVQPALSADPDETGAVLEHDVDRALGQLVVLRHRVEVVAALEGRRGQGEHGPEQAPRRRDATTSGRLHDRRDLGLHRREHSRSAGVRQCAARAPATIAP